jgi:hypothetical protein
MAYLLAPRGESRRVVGEYERLAIVAMRAPHFRYDKNIDNGVEFGKAKLQEV